VKKGAFDLINQPFSLTNHYQKVISLRNKYHYLESAPVSFLNLGKSSIFALDFTAPNNETITVVHNFEAESISVNFDGDILEQINTLQVRPILDQGVLTLAPYSSVILRRNA
jgi:hypothetical protein